MKPACEVCGKSEAEGVYSVPGIPLSVAYCKDCLEKDSHPMWALTANTALCGGLKHCADWWKELVQHSLDAQGKTIEWFNLEVEKLIEDEKKWEDQHVL